MKMLQRTRSRIKLLRWCRDSFRREYINKFVCFSVRHLVSKPQERDMIKKFSSLGPS